MFRKTEDQRYRLPALETSVDRPHGLKAYHALTIKLDHSTVDLTLKNCPDVNYEADSNKQVRERFAIFPSISISFQNATSNYLVVNLICESLCVSPKTPSLPFTLSAYS